MPEVFGFGVVDDGTICVAWFAFGGNNEAGWMGHSHPQRVDIWSAYFAFCPERQRHFEKSSLTASYCRSNHVFGAFGLDRLLDRDDDAQSPRHLNNSLPINGGNFRVFNNLSLTSSP